MLPSLNKGIIIIIIIIINIIMLEDLSFCYREGGLISFNKNNHVNFSDDKKLKWSFPVCLHLQNTRQKTLSQSSSAYLFSSLNLKVAIVFAKSPIVFQVDPNNAPHVGGNTWAGGTGGRDTAGLGGKGGPYRLDAGHDVHQLSDEEKDAVPDDVKRAAREMGRRAFKQRLETTHGLTPHSVFL